MLELSDVLFLSQGNMNEPKIVSIGPKEELGCGNVHQMPIEKLLVGRINNTLKVFYQGIVAFLVKGLAEFKEIKQMSQHYWGLTPAVYSGILSFDYSTKCHSPKKEGAKTLRFWLSITRLSLQLVFELRWEYYSLDNEQYAKTHHLS